MLTLLFILIYLGGFSAGNNCFLKNIIFFNNMRNKINIILYDNKIYFLTRIIFLVRMICNFPYVTLR